MKTALLITNEKTRDEQTYNRVEFTKSLVNRGYNVQTFDVTFDTADKRAIVQSGDYEFAIIASRLHNFTSSNVNSNYKTNLDVLKGLENTVFVNDLMPHIRTCNKWYSIRGLLVNDLPVAKSVLPELDLLPKNSDGNTIYAEIDLDTLDVDIESLGGFPIVYKRLYGAEGRHVHLVHSKDELRELLDAEGTGPASFILQEYIQSAEAAMFCVRVVGDEVLTRMFLGTPYDNSSFKSIVSAGRQQLPLNTTDEIREAAIRATQVLGLDTARMDMFLTSDGIKICEINSIGSLLPTDQTHNVHVSDLIVDLAIEKAEKKRLEADTTNA